jgi:hypothetical protein
MHRPALALCGPALAGLIASACATRPIPEPERIPIPAGLSQQNAEVAILSALTNNPPPGVYDPRTEMSEEEFDRLRWSYYVASPSRAWVVESRQPGRITGVIERTNYRLRTQVRYDDGAATVSIVDSTGLDQTAASTAGRSPGSSSWRHASAPSCGG